MPTPSRPLAVVTGASSGIGKEFARRHAREGHDLVLVARSRLALEALAEELTASKGVEVHVYVADLTRAEDVAALAHVVQEGLPRIEYLVNSAGIAPEGDLTDTPETTLHDLIDLNVTALTVLTRAAVIRMREQRAGAIINIASTGGYQPMPHFATYAATKSFVLRFSEALSREARPYGVRVFAVSPGDTDTAMGTSTAKNKRKPEQVVDTAWRALRGTTPSVIDGTANRMLATLSTRLLPKRVTLSITERMMRRMA